MQKTSRNSWLSVILVMSFLLAACGDKKDAEFQDFLNDAGLRIPGNTRIMEVVTVEGDLLTASLEMGESDLFILETGLDDMQITTNRTELKIPSKSGGHSWDIAVSRSEALDGKVLVWIEARKVFD